MSNKIQFWNLVCTDTLKWEWVEVSGTASMNNRPPPRITVYVSTIWVFEALRTKVPWIHHPVHKRTHELAHTILSAGSAKFSSVDSPDWPNSQLSVENRRVHEAAARRCWSPRSSLRLPPLARGSWWHNCSMSRIPIAKYSSKITSP